MLDLNHELSEIISNQSIYLEEIVWYGMSFQFIKGIEICIFFLVVLFFEIGAKVGHCPNQLSKKNSFSYFSNQNPWAFPFILFKWEWERSSIFFDLQQYVRMKVGWSFVYFKKSTTSIFSRMRSPDSLRQWY